MTKCANLRVCIVDDEARLRELLVGEIGAMGHAATGFAKAEDAWRALQGDAFDVAILDLNLPGMSGMELFGRIREKGLNVAVVVLTGFGSLETAVQSLRWQADDYLTKPCSLDNVEAVLSRLAAKRDAARGGADAEGGQTSVGGAGQQTPTLEAVERQQILAALARHQGNKPSAAEELGISLRTLYNKLNTYKLQGFMQ